MITPPSRWALARGATVLPDGSVRFSVWAPKADRVRLSLAEGTRPRLIQLEPAGAGVFSAVIQAQPGTDYFYLLDDGPPRPDPVSRHRPFGVHGASRIVDSAFRWSSPEWTGIPTAELIIYELHVGTFTPQGTFDAVIDRLPDLRQLGITAIEIMPVAEFPGGRNWGYDGVSLYSPQSTYGGPDGFRRLVDGCHRAGLAVILDVVYNHLGPEGNYLPEFGPYCSDRHKTPWGDGWNLDGPDSGEVRRYLVDNALYWITEFQIDGLRLDAVDQIVDRSAVHLLEEITSAVRQQAAELGRRVSLIAESDANDPRYIRPAGLGGFGFDTQWTDDFHHAVHAALTGETQGYFSDFGGVGPIAKSLRDRFVNDGRYSPYRRRTYGKPAADLPADRFVVCIQNHDQVGNRAAGERLATLISPAALRLGAAVLLLSPYVPLLFMGEEYGEINPFLYFVSHGRPDLVQAVREGRQREFSSFDWSGKLPDPQAESSFARSKLSWSWAAEPARGRLRQLYADLLRLRRTEPALVPGAATVNVSHDEDQDWVTLQLSAGGYRLDAGFNFGPVGRRIPLAPAQDRCLLLSTDDLSYGGSGSTQFRGGELELPPLTAALMKGAA